MICSLGKWRTTEQIKPGRHRLRRIAACEYTPFFEIPGDYLSRETTGRNKHYRISKIKQDKFVRQERGQGLLSVMQFPTQTLASFAFSTYRQTTESFHVLQ